MSANRRDFIKFVVAGAVTAGCPIDLSLVAQTGDPQKKSWGRCGGRGQPDLSSGARRQSIRAASSFGTA